MNCGYCGRPMVTMVYVGDCAYHPECVRGPGYAPPSMVPMFPGALPLPHLTENDVRRIVREELVRAAERGEGKGEA